MVKQFIQQQSQPIPPTKPIPGREHEMVKNEAGGYGFKADMWEQLVRFLILGNDQNTYYASAAKLTAQNFDNLKACLLADANQTLHIIHTLWDDGRAPRQQPIFFALAAATGVGLKRIPCDNDVYAETARRMAYETVPKVCKTLAHYAMFLDFALFFGGSRKGLRRVIREYLEGINVDDLAYQFAKYGKRSGWMVADLIKWSHAASHNDERRKVLFEWALNDELDIEALDKNGFYQIVAMELLKNQYADLSTVDIVDQIVKHRLTREMVPTELLKDKNIWKALGQHMPMMALTRTLNRMGGVGLITQTHTQPFIRNALRSHDRMKKARIHPMDLFIRALRYSKGGDKYNQWEVNQEVLVLLWNAIYELMRTTEASGRRILVALDDSGSMWGGYSDDSHDPSPAELAVGIGLLFARSDPSVKIVRFSNNVTPFPINPNARYDEVRQLLWQSRVGSGTNGSAPVQWATQNAMPIDCFISVTDGQFWGGDRHLGQALEEHRKRTGGEGRHAAFYLNTYNTNVSDPKDKLQMNFVGFDPAAFNVLHQFIKSEL